MIDPGSLLRLMRERIGAISGHQTTIVLETQKETMALLLPGTGR